MALAKFLQVSDLHLGAPFGWLPAERREERRRDQQRALEAAVRVAIDRGVHAILIPGDLFDQEGVDAETLAFAVHVFDAAGCPPVFVAPGNHDPWFLSSPYWSPRLLAARGWAWPGHVHVFSTAGWSSHPLHGLPIQVWGRCFTAHVASAERPLESQAVQGIPPPDAGGLHVALFHGSREGCSAPTRRIAAAFSDDEALRSPFAYMAVGHHHAASRLVEEGSSAAGADRAEGGNDRAAIGMRLAYAGSAVALEASELGAHGALEVGIEYGSGPPLVKTDFIQLDPRCVHDVAVDVTAAASANQIDRRVEQALDGARVTEHDIVTVRLRGRLIRGVRYGGPHASLHPRAFHIRTDASAVRPDYDLDSYRRHPAGTTEERFARALLERLEAEQDPEERAVVESALYYGLDAFRLRQVTPAYEELGG